MFKKYRFQPFIYKAIDELGFKEPTEVQKEVIPLIQTKANVIGKSQTGTGKTHAFLFPILDDITTDDALDTLIIVPTRELGAQIAEEIRKIGKHLEFLDVRLYVGGTDRNQEIARLEKSQPQIAIGTIGKLKDLAIDSNLLKIFTARRVVVDEADMVFVPEDLEVIDQIFAAFEETVQTLVFSATFNQELINFLNKYLKTFVTVDLTQEFSKAEIEHVFIPTKNKDKNALLYELLMNFHPYLALIFTNTRLQAEEVAAYLGNAGLKAALLSGDLEPRQRRQVLKRIKDGTYQYVVATDLAARGMDILGVSHVINYELPNDLEFYIHRTGRTGRADSTGTAISFYDYDDDQYMKNLEAKGLKCVYKALKDGRLEKTKERNVMKIPSRISKAESEIHARIPLGKKVKPGYRKKRKEEINKEIRKMKRAHIDEIYRRKAHKKK
ncbi:MAG: DEAD/DEAH box helicase [Bacilli bacterium]|nr:DEAD/DEAH box helicase [Bacilli bacterium]